MLPVAHDLNFVIHNILFRSWWSLRLLTTSPAARVVMVAFDGKVAGGGMAVELDIATMAIGGTK